MYEYDKQQQLLGIKLYTTEKKSHSQEKGVTTLLLWKNADDAAAASKTWHQYHMMWSDLILFLNLVAHVRIEEIAIQDHDFQRCELSKW